MKYGSKNNTYSTLLIICIIGVLTILSNALNAVPHADSTINTGSGVIQGDLNGDGVVDLSDAILALKVLTNQSPSGILPNYATSQTDVNGDNKIGLEEVIYILRKTARPGLVLSPIGSDGLESYWPLDGDWHDALDKHDLITANPGGFSAATNVRAGNNLAYGPTGADTGNGATGSTFTSLPEENGITLEGWVWLPDDSSIGHLFGFAGSQWGEPNLSISVSWGFIWVSLGSANGWCLCRVLPARGHLLASPCPGPAQGFSHRYSL